MAELYKLRLHLAITTNTPRPFEFDAFRPNRNAIDGISVLDGFKCVLCEKVETQSLQENHDNQVLEFCPVRVQAYYGRSSVSPQLRYVQVTENEVIVVRTETDDIETFEIPANVHSVPASHATITDKRVLNQFGIYVFGYMLLGLIPTALISCWTNLFREYYFHEVQEPQTVDKYAPIWCKILWLACLKFKNQGTMTMNLTESRAEPVCPRDCQ
ncbi:hypothetical protein V1515DRAFT_633631 [Lipomyces mesembrius]